jgi:hypothetical protein
VQLKDEIGLAVETKEVDDGRSVQAVSSSRRSSSTHAHRKTVPPSEIASEQVTKRDVSGVVGSLSTANAARRRCADRVSRIRSCVGSHAVKG